MLAPGPKSDEGIGTLFARLIDEGRDLVSAEFELYRQITLNRLLRSRMAVVLAVIAVLLLQASVTALLLGLVLFLALWLGPVGGAVAVCVTGLVTAAVLLRIAARSFAKVVAAENDKGAGL